MDRLETIENTEEEKIVQEFTFQYGQIRNLAIESKNAKIFVFTFQYGQIRN